MKRVIKISIEIIQEEDDMEKNIDPTPIIEAVCEQLGVDPALKGSKRKVAECITILTTILLKLGFTVSEIARRFKRDRSTIIYHSKLSSNLQAYDENFRSKLEKCEKTIVSEVLSSNQ